MVRDLDATTFIRVPGVDIRPAWDGFKTLTGSDPKVGVFLCHDQCLAHGEELEEAQRQVQWARHAFWHVYGSSTTFLSGMVGVQTGRVSFFKDNGNVWHEYELLGRVPAASRGIVERLLAVNERHRIMDANGTTPLHLPVGVLAIAVGGALDDMRERNLAYVVDWLGQDSTTFARQVCLLANVVHDNVRPLEERPHLVVIGTAESVAVARTVYDEAVTALRHLEGAGFTTELAVRTSAGYESIVLHDAIDSRIR